MNKHRLRWLTSLLAILLVLAACSDQGPATPSGDVGDQSTPQAGVEADPGYPVGETGAGQAESPAISQPIDRFSAVADQLWVLVGYGDALNSIVVEEGALITATFGSADNMLTGSGGCNRYFTGYTSTDDGAMTIEGPIGSTMMACEAGMETEAAYLAALETVSAWSVNDEGRLQLTYSTGQPFAEMLVFAPGQTSLAGNTWRLVSFGDPGDPTPVQEGTEATAVFTPETETSGTISGSATCNNYNGSYSIDGDSITIGPLAGTMMMCPEGMDQETAFLAALSGAQTFAISGENLQIVTDQGVLNFSALDLPLENVLWQATAVAGQPVPEEVAITALFQPGETAGAGSLGGNAGCNNYHAEYVVEGDGLTISGPPAMTMMLCPDEGVAALEASYTAVLEAAASYAVEGDVLTISGAAGDVQFAANRQPLEGTYWELVSLGDSDNQRPPAEGSSFTAQFSRLPGLPTGTVSGETGCNTWNATYAANLSEIKVNLPSTSRSLECAAGAGILEEEQAFFLGLNAATTYRVLGSTLQMPYGENNELMLTFEAGQPPVEAPVLDLTPLQGTFWFLAALGQDDVLPGSEVTAGFEIVEDGATGTISGSGGCNAYNGPIAANFVIGPLVTTKKMCAQPLMDQENAYLNWLQGAYDYDRAGDQLLISTGQGVLTFHSSPVLDQRSELQNRTWFAISYETLNAIQGSNPTVIFSGDGRTISGNTGCNEYSGAYGAGQGNTLTISGMSSTFAACATDELSRQQDTFLRLLPAAVSYRISGQQLQIVTVDGGTMNLTAVPPQNPVPPTAVIVAPAVAELGQQISFDGSRSSAGSLPIARYTWDMGDGTTLSGRAVKYSYGAAGPYTVTLTVTDQGGQASSATHSVQINPVVEVIGPTAVISGPNLANSGDLVTFSGANSRPGTGTISTYAWESGDGNNSGPGSDSSFNTTFAQPGTYTVRLTVVDSNGLSNSTTQNIQISAAVQPLPPKAAISGPSAAAVGEQVAFSAADSQQGTSAIAGYQWQSGDGNDTGLVTDSSFNTIYSQPGTYHVTVTVADVDGLSDSASMAVTVSAAFSGSDWALNGTLPGTSITLEVGNGTLSGFAGCNTYNASYSSTRAAGGSNSISVGPIISSSAACPEEIMAQEQAYLANLQSASAYTISGSTLTLTTAGGPLVYSALVATPFAAPATQ